MNENESNAKCATPGGAAGNSASGMCGADPAFGRLPEKVLSSASARADEQAKNDVNDAMDNMAWNVASSLLLAHLRRCRQSGKYGWYSHKVCTRGDLRACLQECAGNSNWLGVLAYATFLLMRERLGID